MQLLDLKCLVFSEPLSQAHPGLIRAPKDHWKGNNSYIALKGNHCIFMSLIRRLPSATGATGIETGAYPDTISAQPPTPPPPPPPLSSNIHGVKDDQYRYMGCAKSFGWRRERLRGGCTSVNEVLSV